VKYLLAVALLVWSISCPAKRELLVPVLLDYDLYYPDEARRQGMEGIVNVRVLVNRGGKTETIVIMKSSGNSLLDSAAVKTAMTFKFSPAMMGEEVLRMWVMVPIEFKFREIDNEEWLSEVEVLQRRIAKEYSKDLVDELYDLYKQMIYSPWNPKDIEFNYYIKAVVVERVARVWDGYWSDYPARIILFVDMINRYPDSFTAIKARVDLSNFLETEKIAMRLVLDPSKVDTLINRISGAVEY
jgi:TonB family protein